MKQYRYVKLDPTGNITCLVLDPADPEARRRLTAALLRQCEQVAYLQPPENPGTAAAIHLMGGEFCGNAAMASAAWLVREEMQLGETRTFLLEVSGAAEAVLCTVRRTGDCFEGTVEMPGIPEIREESFEGFPITLVRMQGIVHLIPEGKIPEKKQAEDLLRRIAAGLPDEAVGLLQWDRETQEMLPLVYVRGSESLVWEHGCGSGSAAVGIREALRNGSGKHVIAVRQPGGIIEAAAEVQDGKILSVKITGQIRLEAERVIEIS